MEDVMRKTKRILFALATSAVSLAGCYVVPAVGPDGHPVYHHYPIPPYPAVSPAPGAAPASAFPVVLNARLYPDNDIAAQTGVITGTVANMMTGKGRFQLQYGAEILTGEATRVSNDERKGIASAFGSSGSFMSCEYQMNNPRQGAGSCTFSNGARYKLHVGG
jgi:hypothetical protein